jgi:uncharacterized membrane protein YgcG
VEEPSAPLLPGPSKPTVVVAAEEADDGAVNMDVDGAVDEDHDREKEEDAWDNQGGKLAAIEGPEIYKGKYTDDDPNDDVPLGVLHASFLDIDLPVADDADNADDADDAAAAAADAIAANAITTAEAAAAAVADAAAAAVTTAAAVVPATETETPLAGYAEAPRARGSTPLSVDVPSESHENGRGREGGKGGHTSHGDGGTNIAAGKVEAVQSPKPPPPVQCATTTTTTTTTTTSDTFADAAVAAAATTTILRAAADREEDALDVHAKARTDPEEEGAAVVGEARDAAAPEHAEALTAEALTQFQQLKDIIGGRKLSRETILKRLTAAAAVGPEQQDAAAAAGNAGGGAARINDAVRHIVNGVFIRFKTRKKGAKKSGYSCAHILGAYKAKVEKEKAVDWVVDVGENGSVGDRSSTPVKFISNVNFEDEEVRAWLDRQHYGDAGAALASLAVAPTAPLPSQKCSRSGGGDGGGGARGRDDDGGGGSVGGGSHGVGEESHRSIGGDEKRARSCVDE